MSTFGNRYHLCFFYLAAGGVSSTWQLVADMKQDRN